MSVPAQTSVWSIAPQAAKLDSASINVSAANWYKFRVPSVTGGGMQDSATLPLELGGVLTPTGGYKSGAYFVQEVDIIPRLQDTLGYLLEATLGNVSSIASKKYNNNGWVSNDAGSYGHLFRYDPTDQAVLPWLSARLRMPGNTSAQNHGEIGMDCKVSGLRLNIPGAGLITGRFGVQGRKFTHPLYSDVNTWTYANSFEDSKSIAHSGAGTINFGGDSPKVTGLTIDFLNMLTRPQDEQIVGSFFPDDVQVLTRSVRIRAAMKWQNPDLWHKIYDGGASNVDWTNLPYFADTTGSQKAFYFEALSPDVMPALSSHYAIRVMANSVMITCDAASLRLRAGSIIEFMVNIDLLDPSDGTSAYVEVALDNKKSAYSWT